MSAGARWMAVAGLTLALAIGATLAATASPDGADDDAPRVTPASGTDAVETDMSTGRSRRRCPS